MRGLDSTHNKLLLAGIVAVIGNYLPYFFLGQDAHLLIHDNLDSGFVWLKIMTEGGSVFHHPAEHIPNALGGVPAYSLYPYYNIPLLIFGMAGSFWGYVVNKMLAGVIGFVGMHLLLRTHFKVSNALVGFGVSLLFGLLPFWSFTATVSGVPLVLFAFLNIRDRDFSVINWIIIAGYSFYSSVVLTGVFLLALLGTLLVIDSIRNRSFNFAFAAALIVSTVAYLITSFPVIYSFAFNPGYVSHRSEILWDTLSLEQAWHRSFQLFTEGQYHANSFHGYMIIPILFGGTILLIDRMRNSTYFLIMGFLVFSSLSYGFIHAFDPATTMGKLISGFPLQLDRFHFLNPTAWYILLAISLQAIVTRFSWLKLLVAVGILGQAVFIIRSHELIVNQDKPSYNAFFAENEFDQMKKEIGTPTDEFTVINLGMHPSISQYNGFHSLDGYSVNYPLSHKHSFREIIAGELDKDEKLANHFDNWGSRCYAFNSSTKLDFLNPEPEPIDSLAFNFQLLKEAGCEYVLSSATITNTPELPLVKAIQGEYWKIHLYRIQP